MILIIGMKEPKMDLYLRSHPFPEKVMVLDKMCNVKLIKESVHVIVPFGSIQSNGIITNTLVHLPELFMSISILDLVYYSKTNRNEIVKLARQFDIPIIFKDVR